MLGVAQSSVKRPEQKLQHTVSDPSVTYGSAEWTSTLKEMSLWCLHSLGLALLKETPVRSDKHWHISHWQTLKDYKAIFPVDKMYLHAATALKLIDSIYWTFFPPAPCFDNPSNETLSLLSLMMPVHTLCNTHSTHQTVLPATLTHQDLLHCFFTQHRLQNAHTHFICACL